MDVPRENAKPCSGDEASQRSTRRSSAHLKLRVQELRSLNFFSAEGTVLETTSEDPIRTRGLRKEVS